MQFLCVRIHSVRGGDFLISENILELVSLKTKSATSINSIPAVSPEEFANRIAKICYAGYVYIQVVIVPLTLVIMAISVLCFICGSIIKSTTTKKIGVGGVFVALAVLFFFWGLPLLIGIAKGMSKYLA